MQYCSQCSFLLSWVHLQVINYHIIQNDADMCQLMLYGIKLIYELDDKIYWFIDGNKWLFGTKFTKNHEFIFI